MDDYGILYKKIEAQDKIINNQVLEIARLKEQLENDIDRYEDTISYQLGFDKGKEQLQQENKQLKEKIDILLEDNNQLEEIRIKAIEYIKLNIRDIDYDTEEYDYLMNILEGKDE